MARRSQLFVAALAAVPIFVLGAIGWFSNDVHDGTPAWAVLLVALALGLWLWTTGSAFADVRSNPDLDAESRRVWRRALLVWGPLAAAAYFRKPER